jgi:hypothetical protein
MGLSPANPRTMTGTVVVGRPLQTASLAVVVVHGRDQDPHWMLEHLVGRLDLPLTAFILPTIEGRSWYPGRFFDPAEHNEPWVSEALQTCADAVALAEGAGVPVDRIALVGFSQGACLVAEALERDPRPYAAAAILTGGLIGSARRTRPPPWRAIVATDSGVAYRAAVTRLPVPGPSAPGARTTIPPCASVRRAASSRLAAGSTFMRPPSLTGRRPRSGAAAPPRPRRR